MVDAERKKAGKNISSKKQKKEDRNARGVVGYQEWYQGTEINLEPSTWCMSPSCRPDPHQVYIMVIKSPGINFAYAQLCARHATTAKLAESKEVRTSWR